MANNEYARRYRVRHEERTDGVLSKTITYSMVTASEDTVAPVPENPPGFVPYPTFLALQTDTQNGYIEKVSEFLDAIKTDMPEKPALSTQARFHNAAGCPLPTTEPVQAEPNIFVDNYSLSDVNIEFAGDNGSSSFLSVLPDGGVSSRYLNQSQGYRLIFEASGSIKVIVNGELKTTDFNGHPIFYNIIPPMIIRLFDTMDRVEAN